MLTKKEVLKLNNSDFLEWCKMVCPQIKTEINNIEISILKESVNKYYNPQKQILKVYTDGSHFKNINNRKGIGIYFESLLKNISIKVTESFMESEFNLTPKEFTFISNPTLEIAACCYALKTLSENKEKINKIKEIVLYSDFQGVQKWLNGEWKIKKPFIRKIVNKIQNYEKEIKNLGITIKYQYVKAHSGNNGNNMADNLAKGIFIS